MCNFLSAVVLKNGDILSHPTIDSHSELVEYFKLPDTKAHIRHFVKVELTPNIDESWLDSSLWEFRLDEETKPAWWTDEMSATAEADLRRRAQAMVINDDKTPLVLDGCWIVGTKGKIREVRSGRVMRVCGGTISEVRGGTIVGPVGPYAKVDKSADPFIASKQEPK